MHRDTVNHFPFVPAKAGTQTWRDQCAWPWVPAFAGTNGKALRLTHRRPGLLGQLRRRVAIDIEDEVFYLFAGDRGDLEFRLLGLREKVLVGHRVHEGLAQDRDAILRHVGRRHEWAAHHLPAEDQLENVA